MSGIGFPWLPMGTALPDDAVSGRLLEGGAGWQLCAAADPGKLVLLLRRGGPPWWNEELDALARAVTLHPVAALGGTASGALGAAGHAVQPDLLCVVLAQRNRPATVSAMALRNPPLSQGELDGLVSALADLRRRRRDASWASAVVLPETRFALGTEEQPTEDHRAVLLAAASGGARDATMTPERAAELNPRLDAAQIAEALRTLSLEQPSIRRTPAPDPDTFELPGQPRLQSLLREQVLDVLHRPDEYARLGVLPPAGVLLAGPPGCGKSFAANALARFLGWKLHEIRISSVGTAFLHETSRRLADAFDRAARDAPAIVLLEELDAIAAPRSNGHPATVEEVNTLLRLVEGAAARGLFVLGTTNRLEAVDPALRRRGRFDHVVVMDYPDERAAADMLRFLLRDRPHAEGLELDGVARRLARRPASDLAWVVNEAARLAVRNKRPAIDDLLLARALNNLSSTGPVET